MWVLFAVGSSFFAGITAILAKCGIRNVDGKTLLFLVLSGLATGASWLCYYRALQDGPASVVVPIDKLSILVTIAFSWVVFKEKLTKKAAFGLLCILAGTIMMAVL